MTEKQYELQGELIADAREFFEEQFAQQQAINQPIIDQQLETLISQSEFAKSQQERYIAEGVPAQEAAAKALMDLSNTPEGAAYIKELTTAAAEVGGTAGEQAFRTALENYGVSPQEADYMTSLSAYQDPEILTKRLEEGAQYQDPSQVAGAIQKLEDYDSTARVREAEGLAAADVQAGGEAARVAAMQELEKYGIDPSQIASGALDRTLRAQTNARAAQAAGSARRDIQATGLQADVQAGQLAQQSAVRELEIQVNSATQLMQSRVRELQMEGMSAEEARLQADREIGYSQQLAQLETAQRGESVTYSGGAAQEANLQQGKELAAGIDAYNIYAGNPTTSAQAFGTAGAAGGQAAGIANQATQTGLQGYGTISGMYGQQASSLQGGYSVANDIYGNRIASEQARAESAAGPGQLLGSLAGSAVGMMAMSDKRMKKDIERVGETDGGIPIYTFDFKDGGPRQIGLMAQDVEKRHPEAVGTASSGMKGIDYSRLPAGQFNEGGVVPLEMSPSHGARRDDVQIGVGGGEYIFPDDVSRWYGEEKLGKMIEKARTDRQQRQQGGIPQQNQPPQGALPT